MKEILLRYVLPAIICIATVIITIRIQYWFDNLYNDRQQLHQIINMINDGQIEIHKK